MQIVALNVLLVKCFLNEIASSDLYYSGILNRVHVYIIEVSTYMYTNLDFALAIFLGF